MFQKLDRYTIFFHLLGWSIFFSMPLMVIPSPFFTVKNITHFFTSQLGNNLMLVAVFYLNLLVLSPTFLLKKNTKAFVGYALLGLVLVVCSHIFWNDFFPRVPMPWQQHPVPKPNLPGMPMPPMPNHPPKPPLPFPQIFAGMLSYFFTIAISSVLVLWQDRAKTYDTQQKIVLEKVAAELAVLKLQISPHFLFNTLNNIRWLARKKADTTEDAIVKLSQLLRYMLYHSESEKVALSQEINYLQDYIDLQKMRLSAQTQIDFTYHGPIEQFQIEPLLFIPLVENAFKYGIHSFEKSLITIKIAVEDNRLYFHTHNPVFASSQTEDSGIGLQNVRKRLALHYPDKHTLYLMQQENFFQIDIWIQL